MEIGATESATSLQHQDITQRPERPASASEQDAENRAATPTTSENPTDNINPSQRVQPAGESASGQATSGNILPEPDRNSREGIGRFIDTVV